MQEDNLNVPFILKLGVQTNHVEKALAKYKDICISNRDELNKDLKKTFLDGGGIPPEAAYFLEVEERKLPPENENSLRNMLKDFGGPGKENEPLYVGEKLRMQINNYL
jgi:hypothetical protein